MKPPGGDTDRTAFTQHASAVLAYLERRAPAEVEPLTLFRQTMLRAWACIGQFPREDRRQRVWLLATASEVLGEGCAGAAEEHKAMGRSGGARHSRWRGGSALERAERLRAVLPRLEYAQRELVTLMCWDGLTLLEAAEVLGMAPQGGLRQYSAARANLDAALDGAQF
jgi:RNA polymerase sigma-70 factor (ECF subfamily)